jgi:hypothetical protein
MDLAAKKRAGWTEEGQIVPLARRFIQAGLTLHED